MNNKVVDVMENETLDLIGKRLRERLALPDDIPAAIRKVLQALAEKEYGQPSQQDNEAHQ